MKKIAAISRKKLLGACVLVAACSILSPFASPQSSAARIRAEVSSAEPVVLKNSLHPLAQAQFDAGRVPASTRMSGITIVFNRTTAQEADLKSLIAAQQNPASPLYHQWLTPEQFAARFGMADADIAKVQSWLEQQGFAIDSVGRGKNSIHFSGNARQVEQAFATEMHYYKVNGTQHFAPSSDLSLPVAIAPTVLGVQNLDSFRPMSHAISRNKANAHVKANLTQAGTGYLYFSPGDIKTAYDVTPLYNASVTGTGQSITIVGQSAIQTADLEAFQNADGLTVKDPSQFLVPNSGDSTVAATGDESESDLDLEYSNAMAPGATINFVYVGDSQNYSAFDSLEYAVDQKIGTIVSSSYGLCEAALNGFTLESYFEQGTTQGQTFLAAAGDDGSTDCYGVGGLTAAQQEAEGVDYPGSSPYVTSMGGTEISQTNSAYYTPGDGYWSTDSSGTQDLVTSVEKYIPEIVWNDDAFDIQYGGGISAGGGGESTLFSKPSWQTGVPGIPTSGKRYVPDLALYASPDWPGYVFCTSDTSFWVQGQVGSCTSGFEDANQNLTAAGGTSFDAPIFAGLLALINQKQGYSTGQGLINPTLYTLASDATTYEAAFHDITSGNNDCLSGSTYCSSTNGFSAGTGYDEVTGLGSVDADVLADKWPASTTSPTLIATATTVTASNATPNVNTSDNFTVTVTGTSGTPTGTVNLSVDGGTAIPETLETNGTYVYSYTFTSAGSHTITATYAGDSTYATSVGQVTVTVATVSSGSGTITLGASPSTLTVAQGANGNDTITVTPHSGYTGTVDVSFDTNEDSQLQNLCYEFTPNMNSAGDGTVAVTSTTAETTVLNLDANASDCETAEAVKRTGMKPLRLLHPTGSAIKAAKNSGANPLPFSVAFAGLLLAGFMGRKSRKLRGLAGLILLASVGLFASACGGVNNTNTITNPPQGTYTITVTGTDSATTSITANTTFTFVIN